MADYLLAQSSVLGSMLISPQIVGDVMTNLQPEDFTEPMGQEVFLAIRALHLAGEKIDPVCVLNQMGGPDPGRRKYLLALMRETPTAQNYREYMDIVREQSRLREIQRAGLALAGTDITLETAREPVSRLYELMMDRRGVECVDMEQGMLDFYAELERTPRYLPWGMDFLDEGLTAEGGDFVVLGGYPSDTAGGVLLPGDQDLQAVQPHLLHGGPGQQPAHQAPGADRGGLLPAGAQGGRGQKAQALPDPGVQHDGGGHPCLYPRPPVRRDLCGLPDPDPGAGKDRV